MQHLVLVPNDVITDARLLRFAARSPNIEGWRSAVAKCLGAPGLAAAAPAEVARHALDAADELRSAPQAACFASPVQILIGRFGGRLSAPDPALAANAFASKVAESFLRTFSPEEFVLRALPDGGLLLFVCQLPLVTTRDPADCVDLPLDDCLPRGSGERRLRQLSTELETWLHSTEIAPPMTTLWLWGCGVRPVDQPDRVAGASLAVYSRDAYLRGAARMLGASVIDDAISVSDVCDLAVERAVATVRACELEFAVAAVRQGRLRQLDVVTRTCTMSLRRADLYKFWRSRARAASHA